MRVTIPGGEVSHLFKGERLMVLAELLQSATTTVTRILPLPCLLPGDHRQALNWCGSHSGHDGNKAKQAGLIPLALESGGIVFQESPCGTGVPS